MIVHLLQTTLRRYRRHKYATTANVLCLAFGMTCFLIAYSFYAFFASAESGFKRADEIYIIKTWQLRNGEKDIPVAGVPYNIAKQIKDAFPEFREISITTNSMSGALPTRLTFEDKHYDWARIGAADDVFFSMFDIPFISGDRNNAFSIPNGIVISKLIAAQLFGTQDPIGKSIRLDNDIVATVTGVMGSIPEPSHLATFANRDSDNRPYLDGMMSWPLYKNILTHQWMTQSSAMPVDHDPMDNGPFPNASVYVDIRNSISVDNLNTRLGALTNASMKGRDFSVFGNKVTITTSFVPVRQVLGIVAESAARILDMPFVPLLNIFGTLILAIAILNYINLYTTQLIVARKEMGTHQLLGATKMQILLQCAFETFLVCAVALVLALLIFESVKGFLAEVSFVKFNIAWLVGWRFALSMFVLIILVSLISSIYPLLVVSRISPLDSLQTQASGVSQRRLAQILVAMQFSVASVLVFVIVIASQQSSALKKLALHNMSDPVVLLEGNLFSNGIDYHTFVNELSRHSSIKGTAISDSPWSTGFSTAPSMVSETENSRHIRVDIRYVSSNFFNVMHVSLLAGRDFSFERDEVLYKELPQLIMDENIKRTGIANAVIVDRNFISLLGCKSANELLGRTLHGTGSSMPDSLIITGVVDNIYQGIRGAHNEATVFIQGIRNGTPIIQIDKDHVDDALRDIDATMKTLAPAKPIKRIFLDEYYRINNGTFNLIFIIMTFLLVLAIAISIMGMIGMAAHTIARRTREISIRKSLGASTVDIMTLLIKHFAIPVAAANVLIGWPLGWLVSRAFLSLFPYRAEITGIPFAVSLLAVLLISCGAVYFQTYRAARRKPVEVLRYE